MHLFLGVGLPTDNRSCLLPVGLARWEAQDLQAWSVVLWGILALWQNVMTDQLRQKLQQALQFATHDAAGVTQALFEPSPTIYLCVGTSSGKLEVRTSQDHCL